MNRIDIILLEKIGVRVDTTQDRISLHCPFHTDNNPSMSIYIDSGTVKCFSCGYSKGVAGFVRDVQEKSFTVRRQTSTTSRGKRRRKVRDSKSKPLELPKYYEKFPTSIPELKLSLDIVNAFNIGYCKRGFKSTIDVRSCESCWIYNQTNRDGSQKWISNSDHCYFSRKRIMIPINHLGSLYSIESRDITKRASRKILYPNNSRTSETIFDYDRLDQSQPLYVFEGIKNALRARKVVGNTTAIFSNLLKGRQPELLREFSSVVVVPDYGEAGVSMIRSFVKNEIPISVVYPDGVLLCGDCHNIFEGDKELDICPVCASDNINYVDAFDWTDRQLAGKLRSPTSSTEFLLCKNKEKKFVVTR